MKTLPAGWFRTSDIVDGSEKCYNIKLKKAKEFMIDIHSHILPGLDDGSQDIYDTLEMIRLAARSGIAAMVATPHCNIPGGYENYFDENYIESVQRVRDAVHKEGIPVNILPGAEAFGTDELAELLNNGKIMTLNQSRYLLVEFSFDEDPAFVQHVIRKLSEIKVIPIIAHAERYEFVQKNPDLVYDWRKKGYPIQVNKGSFQERFGRRAAKTAYELLNHHLVSVVASDAHSPHVRTPYMADVYEELLMEYPKEYLEMLFYENPRRICQNEPILGFKPKKIQRESLL